MSTAHARRAVAIALAAIVAGACAGDNEVADLTTVAPPPSATAADTTVESTVAGTIPEPTTTQPATTEPAATTAPTAEPDLPDGPTFSDALGVRVDTAPGVHTRGDTRQLLPEGLYVHVAWEADPNDPSVFTVQPDDIEILEAYANAAVAYYSVAQTSRDASDGRLTARYADPVAMFGSTFEQARAGGYVLTLGSGVILRPYVVSLESDLATVYDCYLQDEEFVVEGTDRAPRSLMPKGQILQLRLVSDRWVVETAGPLADACF